MPRPAPRWSNSATWAAARSESTTTVDSASGHCLVTGCSLSIGCLLTSDSGELLQEMTGQRIVGPSRLQLREHPLRSVDISAEE